MIARAAASGGALALLVQSAAAAPPPELRGLVSSASPASCSSYGIALWDWYRADLWSDAAKLPGVSFALSLTYEASFTRDDLADSSVEEMSRISGRPVEDFAAHRRDLLSAFRDVSDGDRITAWRSPDDGLALFVNGERTGGLRKDADLFLSIWLGEKARDAEGRMALLSGRCDG